MIRSLFCLDWWQRNPGTLPIQGKTYADFRLSDNLNNGKYQELLSNQWDIQNKRHTANMTTVVKPILISDAGFWTKFKTIEQSCFQPKEREI